MSSFKILSVNISDKKGETKKPVEKIVLKENYGIIGDAHAGDWNRQVSLLSQEDIDTIKYQGIDISYGDFAENITTEGVDLASLPLGARLLIDNTVLEVTQIGKQCHDRCSIYEKVGDCVMPRKGIFTKVIRGGKISDKSTGTYRF
jgi:MOSC domain-containing protein YiiM